MWTTKFLLHKIRLGESAPQVRYARLTTKTKSMVISREPVRCMLDVDGHQIDHVVLFRVTLSSNGNAREK